MPRRSFIEADIGPGGDHTGGPMTALRNIAQIRCDCTNGSKSENGL